MSTKTYPVARRSASRATPRRARPGTRGAGPAVAVCALCAFLQAAPGPAFGQDRTQVTTAPSTDRFSAATTPSQNPFPDATAPSQDPLPDTTAPSQDPLPDATAPSQDPLPDATALIERVDRHMRGKTQYAEMTMKVVRPDWERETSMKIWMKGRDYSLVVVTAPPRDKGTAFLKRGNEIWNWLPSVGRVIKISPSMMLQPWMGSDFTNDDLVKESSIVSDYTHEILGADEIDGQSCWKLRLIPLPDAAVVWGSVLVWVKQDEPIELRVEFYDEDGELVNVQTLSDIREMGGRRIPTVLTMVPVDKPGHSTVLTFTSATFDEPIDDSFFSEQRLKRVH